jgi:hypothetical protein
MTKAIMTGQQRDDAVLFRQPIEAMLGALRGPSKTIKGIAKACRRWDGPSDPLPDQDGHAPTTIEAVEERIGVGSDTPDP